MTSILNLGVSARVHQLAWHAAHSPQHCPFPLVAATSQPEAIHIVSDMAPLLHHMLIAGLGCLGTRTTVAPPATHIGTSLGSTSLENLERDGKAAEDGDARVPVIKSLAQEGCDVDSMRLRAASRQSDTFITQMPSTAFQPSGHPLLTAQCQPLWVATNGGWCGHDADAQPVKIEGLRLFSSRLTWNDVRTGLLPDATAAAGVPIMQSEASQPNFLFRGRPALADQFLNVTKISPQPPTTVMPVDRLIDVLEHSSGEKPLDLLLYYSAPVVLFADGRETRSIKAPIANTIVQKLEPVAANVTGRVQVNVWLGSPQACTPLHLDERSNLLVVMLGAKEISIFPPSAATKLGVLPWASAFSRSTLAGINGTFNNSESRQRILKSGHRIVLRAGEALYIPPQWLHHVCNYGPTSSFSLSMWRDSTNQATQRVLYDATQYPWDSDWDLAHRIRASIAACKHLARHHASDLFAHVRARYASATLVPDPSLVPTGACTPEGRGSVAARLPSFWLDKAAAALAEHPNDGRILVLGNVLEAMLLASLGLNRFSTSQTPNTLTYISIIQLCW